MRLQLASTLVFLVSSLTAAQQTQPCKSPPYLTGKFFVFLKDEFTFWNYEYNTALQRMRIVETEELVNRSFTYDYHLHFGEGVMYEMNGLTSRCSKRPLRTHYQPIGISDDATFLGNWVHGSLSVPNAGLSVQGWGGYTLQREKYDVFVTEVGCVPNHSTLYTEKYGPMTIVFGNSTMQMTTPDDLSPPRFCPDENALPNGKAVDLVDLFSKRKDRILKTVLAKLNLNKYSFW